MPGLRTADVVSLPRMIQFGLVSTWRSTAR
jgi:hypothetical protein